MQPAGNPSPDEIERSADRAAARGDLAAARGLLEQVVAHAPDRLATWMKLAGTRRTTGDRAGALDAVNQALTLDPLDFMALLTRARLLEDLGRARQAARDYIRALAQAPDAGTALPAGLQKLLDHARTVADDYQRSVADAWQDAIAADPALDPETRGRLARFQSNALRETRIYHSEPSHYHYPGLVEREFHDRSAFPWLGRLEAATDEIRAEMIALVADRAARSEPYVQYAQDAPVRQWAALNHSMDWTAFHLTKGGETVVANATRCPATMAVLAALPQPVLAGRSPNAMFSLLKPRTRIPPHSGIANTRLVCHLPLVVPEGCWFRVGAERREWRIGEAFVFDDTIEHEAANDGDEPRIVMIFDVWHPGLDAAERGAVTRIMAADETVNGAPL